MKSLRAGKATFCEWPLGANLKEAQDMAGLARERSLRTAVGLQARSDPTLMHAQELVGQGYVGEVLAANLSIISGAQLARGTGRVWQAQRRNGANTLTISGGHAIDSLCYILGEFDEVSARVTTRIKEWRNTDTDENVAVDSPDSISIAGRLATGAEVSVQVASVPANPRGGYRLEIYGREGALMVNAGGASSIGPNALYGAKDGDSLQEMEVPDRFKLVPEGTPSGSPRNVAQAYTRLADALQKDDGFDPDFELAANPPRLDRRS